MQARHTISSSSCIGGGEGWSFGGFRECVGAVQVPDFVWQLDTAKDDGPHPIASPRPLKTLHPACFGPGELPCHCQIALAERRFRADWVAPGCAD